MLWYLCWTMNGQTYQSQATLSPLELADLEQCLEADTKVNNVWWECPFTDSPAAKF